MIPQCRSLVGKVQDTMIASYVDPPALPRVSQHDLIRGVVQPDLRIANVEAIFA
jgi:hypothetical protein